MKYLAFSLLASALLAVALITGLRPPARAVAPFVVNSAADTQDNTCGTDPGGCTLRDAIAAANASGGADTITFDPAIFPPDNSGPEIVLGSSLPPLNATDGITVDGTGAGVKINADNSNDGISVISGNGHPANNIVIKKLTFTNYVQNAIKICGGTSTPCTEAVSNVTVQGVAVNYATAAGIQVLGGALTNVTISSNTISFAFYIPISLYAKGQVSGVEIASNTVAGGIGGTVNVDIEGQTTGVDIHDNQSSGGSYGIYYGAVGGHNAQITHNTVHDVLSHAGITIYNIPSSEDAHVTISRNSTYNNGGLGIDLNGDGVTPNDPGDADFGPNDLLNFPVITGSDATTVTGTVCASCKVELFVSDNDPTGYGEGNTFLADATADGSGNFAVPVCDLGLAAATSVTATATDAIGNTSEFSQNFALQAASGTCPTPSPTPTHSPTPTPSPTPAHSPTPSPTHTPAATHTPTPTPTGSLGAPTQGDVNCSQTVDAVDALMLLRHVAALGVTQTPPCHDIGADYHGHPFGDVDCDGDVSAIDALKDLRFVAGLPVTQTPPCEQIGTALG